MTTTISNTLKNSTSYGADVLRYAGLKAEVDSGPLFFALAYRHEIEELSARIDNAKGSDDKVRPIIMDNLKSTPEGEELLKEYAKLLETDKKLRTAEQGERVKALHELQMQVYTQTLRNIDTLKGIVKLEQAGRAVLIQRLPSTTKYACYVVSTLKDDKGNMIEVFHTPFSATQLRKLGTMQTPIDANQPTSDIGKLASSLKQGAANVDKGGNGDGIARADLGKTAHALDAAIAGTIIDGKLEGVSGPTRMEVMMLWARLDAELNDVEKAKARLEFAKLAATPEQVAANAAKEANAAKMVNMLKQGKGKAAKATAA
jgi:hypothetical protein